MARKSYEDKDVVSEIIIYGLYCNGEISNNSVKCLLFVWGMFIILNLFYEKIKNKLMYR